MKLFSKKRIKTIVVVLIIAMMCSNGLMALALEQFSADRTAITARKVTDDVYYSASILSGTYKFKDTWISVADFGSRGGDNAHSPVLFAADDDSLTTWRVAHDGGDQFWFTENYVFTIVEGWWSGKDISEIHYSEDARTWYSVDFPAGYTFRSFIGGNEKSLKYCMFTAQKGDVLGVLITENFKDWSFIEDFPELQEGNKLNEWNLMQGKNNDWYIYSHFENTNRQTADDAYGVTYFYKSAGVPTKASDWTKVGEYDGIAYLHLLTGGAGIIVDTNYPAENAEDGVWASSPNGWGSNYCRAYISSDWNTWSLVSSKDISYDNDYVQLTYRENFQAKYDSDVVYSWEGGTPSFFRGVQLSTDGGASFFLPKIYWNGEIVYPMPTPRTLDGAANWAKEELELALDAGLLIDEMFGKWAQDTSRLLAADAIVRLIEVSTGKTIDEIAAEKGFDMNDKFADTNSKAATFLKASGISNGIDGVNYGYAGTFTRAQLVTMLGRMAENVFGMDLSEYPLGSATFNDIPASMDWAEQYIGWAVALDITQGDGGATTFNPGGNLTNQQTGLFTYRAFARVFSD